ncbi:MAG: DUF4303 domain-containing protein [Planctomycetaceae bacterium]|nr:DUF4303 domain-containing protein [Planctomycetaceae bacterium]
MPANRVMYIEQKTAGGSLLNDRGPAEIGEVSFSKTGTTIYYNGKSFRKASAYGYRTIGPGYNYVCVETGDGYWISGVKQRGTNRHWAGGGAITVGSFSGRTPTDKKQDNDWLLDQLRSGLESAAQVLLKSIQEDHPSLKVRVFVFNIHEYQDYRRISGQVWSDELCDIGDWYWQFDDVNELLGKAYALSILKPFDGRLRQLCMDALRRLDSAGVFGVDEQRQQVVIGLDNPFESSSDVTEKSFFAWAKLLNPPQAIQLLRRELKRRKQTT